LIATADLEFYLPYNQVGAYLIVANGLGALSIQSCGGLIAHQTLKGRANRPVNDVELQNSGKLLDVEGTELGKGRVDRSKERKGRGWDIECRAEICLFQVFAKSAVSLK